MILLLSALTNKLTKFEGMIIGYFLLVMAALAVLQVIIRYMFFYSIPWLEELTRYLMIWSIFIGAALAVEKKINIGIDILPAIIKNKGVIKFFVILVDLMIFTFACLFCYYSIVFVIKTNAYNQLTPALRIPMSSMYISITFGSFLIIIHSLSHLIKEFNNGGEN